MSAWPPQLARGADGAMTGYAYPEMLVGVCRLMAADAATRMTCLTHTCRWSATSSSPVPVAVCKYVLWRRGVAEKRCPAQAGLASRETAAEIDFMLERLGKVTAHRTIGAAS